MGDFTVNCPQCQETLMVSTDFIGQAVNCPSCNTIFKVNAPGAPQMNPGVPPMQPQMNPGVPPMQPQMNPGVPPRQPQMNPGMPPRQSAATKINITKDLTSVSTFVALGALLIACGSLIFNLISSGPTKVSFQKTPEATVEEYYRVMYENRKENNYDWRKNGPQVIDSLEIKEIKTNGDFAVVFYQMSRGAMTYHNAMWLKKNADGYWFRSSDDDAKKVVSEYWVNEMKSRIREWSQKDSNSLNKLVE